MAKKIFTILFSLALSFSALAESARSDVPSLIDSYTAHLSSKIGSSMFEYYKFNYHDQLTVAANLKYCGADEVADKVISSVPDLSSFYRQQSSHLLLIDLVYKEALKNGYTLDKEEDIRLISRESLAKGQAYFTDYLKEYSSVIQRIPNNQENEPFCQAALSEADRIIRSN